MSLIKFSMFFSFMFGAASFTWAEVELPNLQPRFVTHVYPANGVLVDFLNEAVKDFEAGNHSTSNPRTITAAKTQSRELCEVHFNKVSDSEFTLTLTHPLEPTTNGQGFTVIPVKFVQRVQVAHLNDFDHNWVLSHRDPRIKVIVSFSLTRSGDRYLSIRSDISGSQIIPLACRSWNEKKSYLEGLTLFN